MTHDPRAVANLILKLRDQRNLETSNLELQKLLYFCHAYHLNRTGKPLVTGIFEAWQNGPVCPEIYHAFKEHGSSAVTSRAKKKNYTTGQFEVIQENIPSALEDEIADDIRGLSKLSAWQLVDLSHAINGPWDRVVKASKKGIVAGMRISDDLTRKHFSSLKWSIKGNDSPASSQVRVEPFYKG